MGGGGGGGGHYCEQIRAMETSKSRREWQLQRTRENASCCIQKRNQFGTVDKGKSGSLVYKRKMEIVECCLVQSIPAV